MILTKGNDSFIGGATVDVVDGGAGDDVIRGGAGSDRLYGGAGADRIDGGDGNDLIMGGKGVDILYGGSGNDTFAFSLSDFDPALGTKVQDVIYDFKGSGGFSAVENDFLRFTGFGAGSTLQKVNDSKVVESLSVHAPGVSYYVLHDTATNHDFTLSIHDGGTTLVAGDYGFY